MDRSIAHVKAVPSFLSSHSWRQTVQLQVLVVLLLVVLPTVYSSYEDCKNHCDYHRKRLYSETYKRDFAVQCRELNSTEQIGCREACHECPKNVCNPSINNNSYQCPPLDFAWLEFTTEPPTEPTIPPKAVVTCKEICNNYRREKFDVIYLGALQFRCTQFSEYSEEQICRRTCSKCPPAICNAGQDDNVYKCPHWRYKWPTDGNQFVTDTTNSSTLTVVAIIVLVVFVIFGFIGVGVYFYLKRRARAARVAPQPDQSIAQEDTGQLGSQGQVGEESGTTSADPVASSQP